jgi:hypothetical protein
MAKIKISKEEVKQMIREEYFKKLTEIKLKNRLHQINEEMHKIVSENMDEEELEEVNTGGTEKVRSTAWTGEKGGDEKWKPEFQKKGSHLVEDEEITDEIPSDEISDDEISDDEIPSDEISDMEEELDIDAILAKLADAIEDKIESTVDEKIGGEESTEEISTDEIPAEEPIESSDEEDSNEIPEEEDEEIVNEQDGESVAQDQKPKNAVPFDNGKAEIPKTNQLVSEGTKKRMQILSGIRKNDFNE